MQIRIRLIIFSICISALSTICAQEKHRPAIHFTPPAKWMNDPNGMVYHKGVYHLFYQYYPQAIVWGPMHWGHATTKDLVHWQHQPVALYPDSLGYIFSGSAVADVNNTSGFGKNGKTALVAIFTHHDPNGEKAGKDNYQNQSLAYSLDDGKTWTKYSKNPVLRNPGIKDFRDPKVSWYEPTKKWIMTLATSDRISFYSSSDLKQWTKESEFGKEFGAHGGVWECPDLFPMEVNGKKVWILFVSINPGGPNRGSATQYFTGDFDGKTFTPYATDTRWVDHGPDDYAGVTWSGTGKRKLFLGWMSNWQYAQVVPTANWRSAMTIARDLQLEKLNDQYYLRSVPAPEIFAGSAKATVLGNLTPDSESGVSGKLNGPSEIFLRSGQIESYAVTLSNEKGQQVVIGYDKPSGKFYIDRSKSGDVGFEKTFAEKCFAPRTSVSKATDLRIITDGASAEIFADNGLTVMTAIFFPDRPFNKVTVTSSEGFQTSAITVRKLK